MIILKIKSRYAQVGTTLTWIVALLIILFIMLIFLAVVGGLAKIKGTGVPEQMRGKNYLALQRWDDFSLFILNRKIVINGKSLSVLDLIKEYKDNPNAYTKNNLRCMYLLISKDFEQTMPFYSSFYLDNEKISDVQGNGCKESPLSSYFLYPYNDKLIKVMPKFYTCDSSSRKSPVMSPVDKSIITQMLANKELFDSECISVDEKRAQITKNAPIP